MKRRIAVVAAALGALTVGLGAGPADAVRVNEHVEITDAGIRPLAVDLTVDSKDVEGLVNLCISGHTIPVPMTCIKL